ncbi:acyclic terpene utilization AtuA family protein [Bradyrhizobium sp. AS23.2]|uniref:acyclic terpene utilization AtuA family protein n=1 Tax=Bradyrhizobium sp. AS23.2 TaxID=1680155 RepID=UPI00093B79BC|nr:acyclic terpene utilization AtuA family protein [Bradyrhizobium sp. AS23.2]OKO83046.1 terpene utilization protein AtuA [Bradyrhizobium sp. AS23.2]
MSTPRTIRIGGASGFWGDSATATPQLLAVPDLQYLVYDYLAETTMSIMSRARAKDSALGYATDFVNMAMEPHLAEILGRNIRVVANAGGLNPQACCDALLAVAERQGLRPKVAVVTGDDIMAAMPHWCAQGLKDMHTSEPPPAKLMSANAYVGAQGIARALEWGADIVITGRCVDSAVVVGPLVHEFGWSWDDWDRLAAATLAGHVIECGAQATGGLFTDWKLVTDWDRMGYPVIDCAADGSFVLSKPKGTGGLIHPAAVAEQILYEVGDPGSYLMPDVTCDFRQVRTESLDANHVRVSGARGRAPSSLYKCNGTWLDGYQIALALAIRGVDAPAKAQRTAEALLARTRRMMAEKGYADYSETSVELIGCEALYGPNARSLPTREVLLRLAARHPDRKALVFLQRECVSSGTSMAAGTRATLFGRADVQQVVKVFSFLVPKREVPLTVKMGAREECLDVSAAVGEESEAAPLVPSEPWTSPSGPKVSVPLIAMAWARSGDKGDDENIGVIAREPRYLPLLREQLTTEAVRKWFSHLVRGDVKRYEVPGLNALNFVLHQALGGGGSASLRSDPLGKSFAQMLLDFPLAVPADWAHSIKAAPSTLVARHSQKEI